MRQESLIEAEEPRTGILGLGFSENAEGFYGTRFEPLAPKQPRQSAGETDTQGVDAKQDSHLASPLEEA
jgi:hypothetical protein